MTFRTPVQCSYHWATERLGKYLHGLLQRYEFAVIGIIIYVAHVLYTARNSIAHCVPCSDKEEGGKYWAGCCYMKRTYSAFPSVINSAGFILTANAWSIKMPSPEVFFFLSFLFFLMRSSKLVAKQRYCFYCYVEIFFGCSVFSRLLYLWLEKQIEKGFEF